MELKRLTPHNARWRARWAWEFLRRSQIPKVKAPFWFDTEHGKFLCPDSYGPMQFRPGWETETMKIVSRLRNAYFVDVGANLGLYSIIAAKNGNRVLAIEANPIVFDCLVKTVEANGLHDRIVLLNAAAWFESGALQFETTKDYSLGHVSSKDWNLDGRKVVAKQLVASVTLDSVITESPSLVKIDIEGAEPEALMGASTIIRNGARIIFEAVDQVAYDRCRKFLSGYSIEWIGGVNYLAS